MGAASVSCPSPRTRACTVCPEAGREASLQRTSGSSLRKLSSGGSRCHDRRPSESIEVPPKPAGGAAWCLSPSGTGGKRENADGRVGCLLPNRSLLCWSLADVPTESGLRRAMANPFGYRTLDFCDTLWSPGGVLTPAGPPKLHLMIRR